MTLFKDRLALWFIKRAMYFTSWGFIYDHLVEAKVQQEWVIAYKEEFK